MPYLARRYPKVSQLGSTYRNISNKTDVLTQEDSETRGIFVFFAHDVKATDLSSMGVGILHRAITIGWIAGGLSLAFQ